ncbi:MAG: rod shape-determining protein MreC [Elusimicrobiota bacterium]|nr:rod shape-determining protein MreC [Elusimicrobiota bacterium]
MLCNNMRLVYFFKNFVILILLPTQSRLSIGANNIQKEVNFFQNISNLYEENSLLKEKIKNYYHLQNKIVLLEDENKNLYKFLNMRRKIDENIENCRVIGRTIDDWYSAIIIDKGSKNGLEKEDIVVSNYEKNLVLVGQIIEVYDNYSKVLLLTDMDSNVISFVAGKNRYGIVNGLNSRFLEMEMISKCDDVKVGDKIFSSGLGGIFSANIYIGEVKKIEFDRDNMIKKMQIAPFDKIYELLSVVTVIKNVKNIDK